MNRKFFLLFLLTVLSQFQILACESVLISEGDPFPSDIQSVHQPFAEDTTDAVVIVVERNGQWLFGQRGEESSGTDSWGLIGGKIDPGESPEVAAHREVFEELGITLTSFKWILTTLTLDEGAPKNKFFRVFVLHAFFDGELESQEPTKVKNLSWYNLGEIPEKLFEPSKEYIQELKDALLNRK